ncbi:3-dehydroquinate dehydratase [Vibrio alginolyticus 12G01]|nr:3-dehydroquinate dehydratase [Vibrio alginolyticus 12G01]
MDIRKIKKLIELVESLALLS